MGEVTRPFPFMRAVAATRFRREGLGALGLVAVRLGLNRRSSNELVTTLTLENAIAAPATQGNGESSPTAATGMSAAL